MINLLLPLLTTIFIQLGTVGIPYELVPTDDVILLINEIRNACSNSSDPAELFFYDTVQEYGYSEMPYYIELGSNGSNNYRVCFPASFIDSSVSSSCECTWFLQVTGALLVNIRWTNYYVFYYNSDTGQLSNSSLRDSSTAEVVVPYRDGEGRTRLVALNGDIRMLDGTVVVYYADFINSVEEGLGLNALGAMTLTGHSSGGNPLDNLDGFSFSSPSGQFALTGHSVGVSQNSSTPDFSNPVQNLLGQIVDNTNNVIQNIKGLGDVLSGVGANVREGFSSIFNAISGFNDNINNFINYIIEPLDQDMVMDHVNSMSFMQLSNSISSAASHVCSSFNNVSNNQSLVFPIDLRNTYFSDAGIMYLDLSFR